MPNAAVSDLGLHRMSGGAYARWIGGVAVFLGLPLVGTIGWMIDARRLAVDPRGWMIFLATYSLGMIGVTVGAHRLFSHRAFRAKPLVEVILAILASMTQGSILVWVANHRWHHAHSDAEEDLHSPLASGDPSWRSLLHAHVLWIFSRRRPSFTQYARDWHRVRGIALVDDFALVWPVVGLGGPVLAAHVLWPEASDRLWMGFVWGALAIFAVQHVTFLINSLCHLVGYRSYPTRDGSVNNRLVGIFGFGEGWHNNHHWRPSSARFGHRRGEFDLGFQVIRLLCWIGVARLRGGRQESRQGES